MNNGQTTVSKSPATKTRQSGGTATANAGELDFLARYIAEELERLEALSIALEKELCPKDPDNLREGDKVTAWRLAELLNERLSSRAFSDYINSVLRPQSNHLRAAA